MSESGLAKRFSRGAAAYDATASIQREVVEDLLAWTPAMGGRVLDVGCGSGFLTRHLKGDAIHAIDLSSQMIALCRERVPAAHCEVADFRTWQATETYDLLVSSSTLHWIVPFEDAAKQMAETCDRFSIALMLEGSLPELRAARSEIAPGKALPALPKASLVARALREAGVKNLECKTLFYHQEHEDGHQLLRELHRLGLSAGARQLLTRRELKQVAEQLGRPCPTTWQVGFFRGQF